VGALDADAPHGLTLDAGADVTATVIRVVLTGSESTGKTTLAARLADHYRVFVVPEFVRSYAQEKVARGDGALSFRDHGPIARGVIAQDEAARSLAASTGTSLLLYDTDLVSTVVYCDHYFGRCPPFIEDEARARLADLYLLLDIDVPWVEDGVRDRGDRRDDMQGAFRAALTRVGAPVEPVTGGWDERFAQAVRAIDSLRTSRSRSGR
jgi:NadR type nicotinamide-nucleotide adenylyltransferase